MSQALLPGSVLLGSRNLEWELNTVMRMWDISILTTMPEAGSQDFVFSVCWIENDMAVYIIVNI